MLRQNKIKIISAIVLIVIVTIYGLVSYFGEETTAIPDDIENVYVHFVDAGQADCTVIQTPDGNILIDAGLYDTVNDTLAYIDSLGITEFAYAIFTHPHSDHIGGAGTMILNYDIDTVILPNVLSTGTPFVKMMEAIEADDCKVIEGKAGVSMALGDLKIELLAPVFDNYEELNNASIVSKLTYKDVSFLFPGDAEELSEFAMLNRDIGALDSTVLKVSHHGSSTSSCKEFLNAISPEIAVYSCGKNNDYGHPHAEVVRRFNSMGIETYRTDKQGSIVLVTDGKTYSISTEYKN